MAAIAVSLGSLIVGFSSGYTSPALPSMKENATRVFEMDKNQVSAHRSLIMLLQRNMCYVNVTNLDKIIGNMDWKHYAAGRSIRWRCRRSIDRVFGSQDDNHCNRITVCRFLAPYRMCHKRVHGSGGSCAVRFLHWRCIVGIPRLSGRNRTARSTRNTRSAANRFRQHRYVNESI